MAQAQPEPHLDTWTRLFQIEANSLNQEDTWNLEFNNSIEPKSPQWGWEEYIRNTSARFKCTLCKRSWPSNHVKVLFHMCLLSGTGTVKVRPCRQKCKICKNAPLVRPSIDDDNIRILLENLVKKIKIKCYHEEQSNENLNYRRVNVNNPHEPEHCEGCIKGICVNV